MSSIPAAEPPTRRASPRRPACSTTATAQNPDPYPVECKYTALAIAAALRPVGLIDADWFSPSNRKASPEPPGSAPPSPTPSRPSPTPAKSCRPPPVGFLCDHVEILYDIDIDFKAQAAALGMQLSRAESLNASPTLIRAIDSALHRHSTRLDPNAAAEPARPRPAHAKA